MAAARAFVRKYWILIVIALWVIAWANRDWLAGGVPAEEDVLAETADVAEPHEPTGDTEPTTPDAAPESRMAAPDETVAQAPPEETTSTVEFEPMPAAPGEPIAAAPPEDTSPMMEIEAARVSEESVEPDAEMVVATTDDRASEPVDTVADAGDPLGEPVAPAKDSGREDKVAVGKVDEPAEDLPDDQVADTDAGSAARQAELFSRARTVARTRGPRAAVEILERGLREFPASAPGRADIHGEIGNYQFTARNFTAALAAYDRALQALPVEERDTMLHRLGPVYDRYHPEGRSHLEQFR